MKVAIAIITFALIVAGASIRYMSDEIDNMRLAPDTGDATSDIQPVQLPESVQTITTQADGFNSPTDALQTASGTNSAQETTPAVQVEQPTPAPAPQSYQDFLAAQRARNSQATTTQADIDFQQPNE